MASDRMPWFPLYVADFTTSETVKLLSNAELGVYMRLLCHQWIEGSIPADRDQCFALAQIRPDEFEDLEDLWTSVQRLFNGRSTDRQRMFNEKMESVRCSQSEKHQKRTAAARSAGVASAKSRKTNNKPSQPNVEQTLSKRSTSVNHTESESEADTEVTTTTMSASADFVAAWNALAPKFGLARVKKLTNDRKRKLLQRLKDPDFTAASIEDWVIRSEGVHHQAWFDFDFILSERKFAKLIEGKYIRPFGENGNGRQHHPNEGLIERKLRELRGEGAAGEPSRSPQAPVESEGDVPF